MQLDELVKTAEAVLFAVGEPIELQRFAEVLEIEQELVPKVVRLLNDKYEENDSPLTVLKLENSFQLSVRQEFTPCIKKAIESKKNMALSPAAMEVLTIVAYNQPVTKSFVESVRGVDSASVVNSLVEKNLLAEAGRLDLPGRPIAFKTTSNFLRCFKLSSISELPPLPDTAQQLNIDDLLSNLENNE